MKGLHNEKELLERVIVGDQEAYKTIFSHYWQQVYAVALMFTKLPELAEDMTQDVFAAVWVKRDRLAEVEKFEAWLFIIARNLFYDRLRKKTFSGACDDYLQEYFKDEAVMPHQQLEIKDFEGLIYKEIGNLPPRQQTAFRLSRLQGLTHEEIAVKMGVSRQSVKSYVVRSIVTLRKFVKQNADSLHSFFGIF